MEALTKALKYWMDNREPCRHCGARKGYRLEPFQTSNEMFYIVCLNCNKTVEVT